MEIAASGRPGSLMGPRVRVLLPRWSSILRVCGLKQRSSFAGVVAESANSRGSGNGSAMTASGVRAVASTAPTFEAPRIGEVERVTKETSVQVKLNLDGSGIADCQTGIPFLDHMLDQLASHGLFDVSVKASGDIHIDDHHTNEDVALAIGTALLKALGDRKGISRFGNFSAPLDEAAVNVILDLSGRPHLSYNLRIPTERVGTYDTQLVEHFFQSLVNTSGMTLHIQQGQKILYA
ncbi:imidazoleglycerol-phosphate dehydratase isoform X2 [Wolffia australiana]